MVRMQTVLFEEVLRGILEDEIEQRAKMSAVAQGLQAGNWAAAAAAAATYNAKPAALHMLLPIFCYMPAAAAA
eukprot:1151098-Pelagomonas_calceolata.AAC.5